MGDLLSAASLLLAVVAVIYGLWYPEIEKALAVNVPAHRADRVQPRVIVRYALVHRAVPLALFSTVVSCVFLPDTASIISRSIAHLAGNGAVAVADYDAVATSLVLVTVVLAVLAVHLSRQAVRLRRLLTDIDGV